MGVLDRFSNIVKFHRGDSMKLKKMRKKQLQTVEIMVEMDCEGCERKVRNSVEGLKGVTQIEIERSKHKLTVDGYVDPEKVLHRVRHHTGKKAEFWPHMPYDVVNHSYTPMPSAMREPSGYVDDVHNNSHYNLNVVHNNHHYGVPLARASSTEVKYYTSFSDDNTNACSVM